MSGVVASDRPRDRRVLVLAPTGRDAELAVRTLRGHGVDAEAASSVDALCEAIASGEGAAVVAEEALPPRARDEVAECLAAQPPWSEFPLVLLSTRAGEGNGEGHLALLRAFEPRGNVTVLERPLRVTTLVSTVLAALRARRRQYEVRDRLEELREADRRKNEFLAMLAHELRNPLAPIRSAVELMRAHGVERPELRWAVEVTDRQVGQLARLVDDLLDVARITQGRIVLRRERADLSEVAQRAVEENEPLVRERRHRLEVDAAPLSLVMDPARMAQVVSNLLSNAAKYTEPGGRIRLRVRREGGEAVIRVADTGIGIPPGMQPALFEVFSQDARALDRSEGGLGLGLALTRRLVELHGGTVEARSEGRGRGSEFAVRLPAPPDAEKEEAETPADRHPAPPPARRTARRRVLVVDDNSDAADSLAQLVRLRGHDAVAVYDAGRALEEAGRSWPDVAILDIGLPRIDGYELARRLRAEQEGRPLRLIALSGYGRTEDRARSREAGFDAHLLKPVDLRTLEERLAGG